MIAGPETGWSDGGRCANTTVGVCPNAAANFTAAETTLNFYLPVKQWFFSVQTNRQACFFWRLRVTCVANCPAATRRFDS